MTSDGDSGNGRILTEDEQRVRSYLVDQGDQKDWVDLWPRFIQERGNLLRAIEHRILCITHRIAIWLDH